MYLQLLIRLFHVTDFAACAQNDTAVSETDVDSLRFRLAREATSIGDVGVFRQTQLATFSLRLNYT